MTSFGAFRSVRFNINSRWTCINQQRSFLQNCIPLSHIFYFGKAACMLWQFHVCLLVLCRKGHVTLSSRSVERAEKLTDISINRSNETLTITEMSYFFKIRKYNF
ncbi:hypothetical protein XELAEV_18027745mg [Xenopus laevis]|uniref:Uncharacterized protein n=1 Tax=Xenopus laevis TaxID=8355 RepID=A0A974CW16_XENLA|nr:hypothetical protein XELAEV_18027745mg [Xenopus laevis]